jgi:hypothetical protein
MKEKRQKNIIFTLKTSTGEENWLKKATTKKFLVVQKEKRFL